MPICFIICCYTVIKCQHLPAGEQGSPGGEEHVVSGHHQHLVPCADAVIGGDDVFRHRVLSVRNERGHILLHRHPVGRGGKNRRETSRSGDPEGQAAVLCSDGGKPLFPEANLADASRRRELKGAFVGKYRSSCPGAELEVSYYPDPLKRTVV